MFYRWDISSLDQLPEYMRHCYQAILYAFAEAKEEIAKAGRTSYGIDYAINAVTHFKWSNLVVYSFNFLIRTF